LVLDWYSLAEEIVMSGRILKRGDAWQLRVYLGLDAATGKQR
jgi:hypothetical protein